MRFAHQFATHFAEGLADNWSQVRMAGENFNLKSARFPVFPGQKR